MQNPSIKITLIKVFYFRLPNLIVNEGSKSRLPDRIKGILERNIYLKIKRTKKKMITFPVI